MKKSETDRAIIPTVGHAKRRAYATADAYLDKHMRRVLDEYASGSQRPLDETAWHIDYLVEKQKRRQFSIDRAAFRMVISKQVRASRPNEAQSPPRYVQAEPQKSDATRERFNRYERAVSRLIADRLNVHGRTSASRDIGLGD